MNNPHTIYSYIRHACVTVFDIVVYKYIAIQLKSVKATPSHACISCMQDCNIAILHTINYTKIAIPAARSNFSQLAMHT